MICAIYSCTIHTNILVLINSIMYYDTTAFYFAYCNKTQTHLLNVFTLRIMNYNKELDSIANTIYYTLHLCINPNDLLYQINKTKYHNHSK